MRLRHLIVRMDCGEDGHCSDDLAAHLDCHSAILKISAEHPLVGSGKSLRGDLCRSNDSECLARFDTEVIIDRSPQLLLTAEITLSRLYRDVPKQKLNLI
jgi:hypothetical protein